jgi:hypothetical protein
VSSERDELTGVPVGDAPPPGPESPVTVEDGQPSRASPSTTADEPLATAITRTRLLIAAATVVVVLVGLYFFVPKLAGLRQTWGQLRRGDPLWFAAGGALELLSIAGYAALFRTVFGRGVPRIDWRVSLEIPLAGIAAIRLIAAAGAGSVAVTVWALRRAGMSAEVIASLGGHAAGARSSKSSRPAAKARRSSTPGPATFSSARTVRRIPVTSQGLVASRIRSSLTAPQVCGRPWRRSPGLRAMRASTRRTRRLS